jgi:TPR repeat protein
VTEPEPEPEMGPRPVPKAKSVSIKEITPPDRVEELVNSRDAADPVNEELAELPSEKISEKDISDFLAHARLAASKAALAETTNRPPGRSKVWLAWGGVAAVLLLLLGTGLLLGGRALGLAEPMAAAGVSHRHVAEGGITRIIALADSGNATAQTMLAFSYLRGIGIAGDENAAMRWSKAAASQGQPVAEYLLGTLYLEGNRDDAQAVHWFQAAANQGNIKAMHNLGIAYAEGLGVDKDPVQAVNWFVRAAEQGYRDSEFDLGVLYERGLGVPQDAAAALKWYLIAAGQGDTPSAERAQFLKTQMDAVDVKAASDAAAAFTPQPAGTYANDILSPTRQG